MLIMAESVEVASPDVQFDVSTAARLRKQVARAATSLKFIGFLSAMCSVADRINRQLPAPNSESQNWIIDRQHRVVK
jgi:hypothetical protein